MISQVAMAELPLVRHFRNRTEGVSGNKYSVIRLDVDVTGDGNPDLLLAVSDRVPWWSIYEKVGVSQYRYLGHLALLSDYFRVKTDPPRVIAELPPSQPDVWRTVVKRFDGNRFVDCVPHNSPECLGCDNGCDDAEFAAWRKRVKLREVYVSLDDLRTKTCPEWKDSITGTPVQGVGCLHGMVVVDSPAPTPTPAATLVPSPTGQ
jgi:hypothetical protein